MNHVDLKCYSNERSGLYTIEKPCFSVYTILRNKFSRFARSVHVRDVQAGYGTGSSFLIDFNLLSCLKIIFKALDRDLCFVAIKMCLHILCGHLAGSVHVFVYVASYLPCLLNFTATVMPRIKLKIPNTTKPPATPPNIAAVLDLLSKGTKGVCVCVCVKIKIVLLTGEAEQGGSGGNRPPPPKLRSVGLQCPPPNWMAIVRPTLLL